MRWQKKVKERIGTRRATQAVVRLAKLFLRRRERETCKICSGTNATFSRECWPTLTMKRRRRRSRRSKGGALRSLQIGVSTIKEELDNQKTEIENIKELLNEIMKIMAANSDARRLPTVESPSLTVSS